MINRLSIFIVMFYHLKRKCSYLCFEICEKQDRTCLLSLASGLRIICAKWAMAPASTTVWASSGECLQMSESAEAATRLRESSGSWIDKTKIGTAPASTTAWKLNLLPEGVFENCTNVWVGYLPGQVHHYDGQCNQEPMQQPLLHLKQY